MGQGIATSYLQIFSEQLQIPVNQLKVVQGDTDLVEGHGSVGSRSLFAEAMQSFAGSRIFWKNASNWQLPNWKPPRKTWNTIKEISK